MLHLIPDHPGAMKSRAVLLQNYSWAHDTQSRDDLMLQNFISLAKSDKVAQNQVQHGCPCLMVSIPDHDWPFTIAIVLFDAGLYQPLA